MSWRGWEWHKSLGNVGETPGEWSRGLWRGIVVGTLHTSEELCVSGRGCGRHVKRGEKRPKSGIVRRRKRTRNDRLPSDREMRWCYLYFLFCLSALTCLCSQMAVWRLLGSAIVSDLEDYLVCLKYFVIQYLRRYSTSDEWKIVCVSWV